MTSRALQTPRAKIRCCCARWLFVVLTLLGLSARGIGFQALAQSDEGNWTTPLNLSHSGAASSPAITVEPDGDLRVFWWDQFDGLMVADGPALSPVEGAAPGSGVWSEPRPAPIFLVETITTTVELETPERETVVQEELVFTPIETMPRIVADAAGRAHAFWLGEPNEPQEPDEPDEETGFRPLMYSRLASGSQDWAWAGVVAISAESFDVAADARGVLHLVYVRASHSRSSPAGLYYRRSNDGGATWSASRAIHQSRYFRLFSAEDASEDAHVRLTVDDTGGVYVTWDDPHLEQVSFAYSADGGMTWQMTGPVGDPDGRSQRGQIMAVPGGPALSETKGEVLLVWEDARIEGACSLYQASASELLTGAAGGGQWVLEGLTTCLENKRFLPLGEAQALMVASSGGDTLALAAWDGSTGVSQWSEPRWLNFHFVDPELGETVYLSDLQAALVRTPSSGDNEQASGTLVVVGTDQHNEVWITGSQVEALERFFAPPPLVGREAEPETSGPVNLSHSGAASSPAIVAGPDETVHVFWWDQFDGLMAAQGAVLASTVLSPSAGSGQGGTEEISATLDIWSEPRSVPAPVVTTPRIVADAAGRIHAFWLEETAEETTARPLMHSRLVAGGTALRPFDFAQGRAQSRLGSGQAWSLPSVVAESAVSFDVATDASGVLHLAYLRARHTPDSPAGLYYRRSDDGGGIWSAPAAIQGSRYFRLLAPETAHVRLAADERGGVYVTWDDPRLEGLLLAHSPDGGGTWGEPRSVGDPDGQPQRGRLVAVPGGETLLLWQDARLGGACNLYQAPANELLAGAEGAGQRVLEELTTCPEKERFLPLGEGQALMVAGGGSDTLTLAAWDGSQWSELRRLSFRFEDPQSGEQVYLSGLQAALVELPPNAGEGLAAKALIAVGTDQQGDVWATGSQMGALELVFAPPSPWSAPVSFAESEGLPGLPALAADAEGRLHALWSEAEASGEPGTALFYARWDGSTELTTGGTRWTRPVEVLGSPNPSTGSGLGGGAEEPSLAAVGNRLHAVWSGGQNGEIFHSRAFLRDAYAAGGWSEPQPLPAPATLAGSGVGSWPDIAAGAGGALHVVYAVPLNEGRGIYYTRSGDAGETWSPAQQVFDAAGAGWAMADYPRLAIDAQGTLHVVWVRAALAGGGLPQGVYYARSSDGGQTWSGPLEVAEGAYAWPQVAASAPGQVHLLWNEATEGRALRPFDLAQGRLGSGQAWWHQWSTDGGVGWTRSERVRGFGDVPGPVGLVSDGAGMLHLTGLGYDDAGEPVLLYATWDGERWSEGEAFRLELDEGEPGVTAALLPVLGRLDVPTAPPATQEGLWHTGRMVPAVAVTPMPITPPPAGTPEPAQAEALTPSAAATPLSAPTPTPDFSGALPPTAGGSMSIPLPLLLGGGLAALIVVGVLGSRLLWAGRR